MHPRFFICRRLFHLYLLLVAMLVWHVPSNTAYAQQESARHANFAQEEKPNRDSSQTFMPNRFGVGISYATGNAALGAPEAMVTALYEHEFTQSSGIEIAVHYLAGKVFNTGAVSSVDGFNTSAQSVAWTADISYMLHGRTGLLTNFSLGIGTSLQAITQITTNITTIFDPRTGTVLNSYTDAGYKTGLGVGAHVKLEYMIPIDEQIDCAVRLQYHQYMASYIGSLVTSAFGNGSAGIGAFFRVRF